MYFRLADTNYIAKNIAPWTMCALCYVSSPIISTRAPQKDDNDERVEYLCLDAEGDWFAVSRQKFEF